VFIYLLPRPVAGSSKQENWQ